MKAFDGAAVAGFALLPFSFCLRSEEAANASRENIMINRNKIVNILAVALSAASPLLGLVILVMAFGAQDTEAVMPLIAGVSLLYLLVWLFVLYRGYRSQSKAMLCYYLVFWAMVLFAVFVLTARNFHDAWRLEWVRRLTEGFSGMWTILLCLPLMGFYAWWGNSGTEIIMLCFSAGMLVLGIAALYKVAKQPVLCATPKMFTGEQPALVAIGPGEGKDT